MDEVVATTKIRRAYGRIKAIMDQEGVTLKTFATLPIIMLATVEGNRGINLDELALMQPYDDGKPPRDWDAFLAEACDMFVRKNADYGNSFMVGLMTAKDARYFWAWEATKKLNRVRTWLTRGQLDVAGEKVKDAVADLFGYTVQYSMFLKYQFDPLAHLNEAGYYAHAASRTVLEWVEFYADLGVLFPAAEGDLIEVLLKYMGRGE